MQCDALPSTRRLSSGVFAPLHPDACAPKLYMGYVRDSPNLDPREQYFALIPILSGAQRPTIPLRAERLGDLSTSI